MLIDFGSVLTVLIGNSSSFKKICSIKLTCAFDSMPRSFSSSSGVSELSRMASELGLPSMTVGVASVPFM
jgi:hypothetical protein